EPHETGLGLQRVEHPLPGQARAHVRIPLSAGPRREKSICRAALDTATTVPVPNTPSRSNSEAVPTATPSAPRCSSASIPKSALRGSRASATVRSALMKPMPSVPQLVMRLVASPSVTARWKGVASSSATTSRDRFHERLRRSPWCAPMSCDQYPAVSPLPQKGRVPGSISAEATCSGGSTVRSERQIRPAGSSPRRSCTRVARATVVPPSTTCASATWMRLPLRTASVRTVSGSTRTGENRSTVRRAGWKPSRPCSSSRARAAAATTAGPLTISSDQALRAYLVGTYSPPSRVKKERLSVISHRRAGRGGGPAGGPRPQGGRELGLEVLLRARGLPPHADLERHHAVERRPDRGADLVHVGIAEQALVHERVDEFQQRPPPLRAGRGDLGAVRRGRIAHHEAVETRVLQRPPPVRPAQGAHVRLHAVVPQHLAQRRGELPVRLRRHGGQQPGLAPEHRVDRRGRGALRRGERPQPQRR